eukprot:GHVL01031719.1.p1 GENE.GHVL01031719.1~~GHVL01031719.1.p1  ORF type:complete len:540 (-),score=163.34 GHVL01031719.1:391-1980(-)
MNINDMINISYIENETNVQLIISNNKIWYIDFNRLIREESILSSSLIKKIIIVSDLPEIKISFMESDLNSIINEPIIFNDILLININNLLNVSLFSIISYSLTQILNTVNKFEIINELAYVWPKDYFNISYETLVLLDEVNTQSDYLKSFFDINFPKFIINDTVGVSVIDSETVDKMKSNLDISKINVITGKITDEPLLSVFDTLRADFMTDVAADGMMISPPSKRINEAQFGTTKRSKNQKTPVSCSSINQLYVTPGVCSSETIARKDSLLSLLSDEEVVGKVKLEDEGDGEEGECEEEENSRRPTYAQALNVDKKDQFSIFKDSLCGRRSSGDIDPDRQKRRRKEENRVTSETWAAIAETGRAAEYYVYQVLSQKLTNFDINNWVSSARSYYFPNSKIPIDDGLGYDFIYEDIDNMIGGGRYLIEVKGTSKIYMNQFELHEQQLQFSKKISIAKRLPNDLKEISNIIHNNINLDEIKNYKDAHYMIICVSNVLQNPKIQHIYDNVENSINEGKIQLKTLTYLVDINN